VNDAGEIEYKREHPFDPEDWKYMFWDDDEVVQDEQIEYEPFN
jgi:hypothetical protein